MKPGGAPTKLPHWASGGQTSAFSRSSFGKFLGKQPSKTKGSGRMDMLEGRNLEGTAAGCPCVPKDELSGTTGLDEQGTSEGTSVLRVQASMWTSDQLAELPEFLQCLPECFLIRGSTQRRVRAVCWCSSCRLLPTRDTFGTSCAPLLPLWHCRSRIISDHLLLPHPG